MRILVTGATGFVGRHLTAHLHDQQPDDLLFGTTKPDLSDATELAGMTIYPVDLRERDAVLTLVGETRPDQIYHLAAQAAVGATFSDPWDTLETNIHSQLNIFEACAVHNLKPRVLVVSSGEIYATANRDDRPTDEFALPQPSSPYSVSKITQEALGLQYFHSQQIPVLISRPFNQIGPGQNLGFVAPDFASQIAKIEAGQQSPLMRVGNLEARRDFTDVRDSVRGQRLIMKQGVPGEIYNIASGIAYPVQQVLDTLLNLTTTNISVEPDPARMRPSRVPLVWGDSSKLHQLTGWQPMIPFEQSLREILNDFRQRVSQSSAST
ncbi:MAG: GDP-mannose 4,6-dehydratase [Anaerolineae bacterium]|nr:GDP-mannose 4,6-dehydratase [Anaerolineae bacterium]